MATLSKQEKTILKEKFIREYCKKKGWNMNSLTSNQMLEIVSQSKYKSPSIK